MAMSIESEVGWWFGFAHILVFRAFEAVSKVNTIPALAVEEVPDFEYFVRLVAGEVLGGGNLSTAFVFRSG